MPATPSPARRLLVPVVLAAVPVLAIYAAFRLPVAWAVVFVGTVTIIVAASALTAYRLTGASPLRESLSDAEREVATLQAVVKKREDELASIRKELHASTRTDGGSELEATRLAVLNLLEDAEHQKNVASEARARMEAVITSIADGVCVVDDKLAVVMCNPAAEAMFGLTGQEYVGKAWEKFHVFQTLDNQPIAPESHPIQKAIATGVPVHVSLFSVRQGDKLPLSISSSPVRVQGEVNGAVAVFRDIT
ncbi:MAG: hypothetical protein RLZZ324_621, partial [Candidatus Parcubacteria bacterium]